MITCTYRYIITSITKEFIIESYLQRDIHSSLRLHLQSYYSHRFKFMSERVRWMKPKIQYIDRKCTLCNDNDIQNEYHIVLKSA